MTDASTTARRDRKRWAAAGVAAVCALAMASSAEHGLSQEATCSTDRAKDAISDSEAQALYECIADTLLDGYVASGVDAASAFRNWTQASTVPFVSATHGGRYVIHYVNDVGAEAYLRYEDIGADGMPEGSVAAKESFNVDDDGKVVAGPLFLMTKVAAGALPDTADWRYSLVLPNGKVMGTTGGEGGERVAFCHACHATMEGNRDAMLLPKDAYRVPTR